MLSVAGMSGANVYIDGFIYCVLLKSNVINCIRYLTAHVGLKPDNLFEHEDTRQRAWAESCKLRERHRS